jgi:hypothetical protein
MFRKLRFIAAVPALLILLTAGAVQARPLTVSGAPDGLLAQAWQWAKSGLASVGIKAGGEMDPHGNHTRGPLPQTPGGSLRRGAGSPGETR